MPTGYTAALYEGEQSFEDYALGVARGFGALITLRDEPNAEIPEVFEPASYYVRAVDAALSELDAICLMSEQDLRDRQEREIREAQEYRDVHLRENAERRARYTQMLERARAYVAPTPDHEQFARTLVGQLEQSLDFDCGGSYEPPVPERLPLSEYREQEVAAARDRLVRAREALAEEDARAETRTAWVQALRDSLQTATARP